MNERISFVPLTDLNRGKASKIIETIQKLKQAVFIVKNNKPEAVLISFDEYQDYQEYLFYKKVNERVEAYVADAGITYSRDQIMKEYQLSDDDLDEMEEIEFDYD